MDGTAIKELYERFSEPHKVDDDLVAYPNGWMLADKRALVKHGPTPATLDVYSLGAVRDYLTANRDALELDELVAHVVSPQIVTVSGALHDTTRHRETYVKATANNLTDGFLGKFMPVDEFIVGLLTRFAPNEDRAAVLRLFGNVKHEGVKTLADDGVTQTVTAKTGVVLANEVAVPNPVSLVPYRTFREVTQPTSPFVLRVNGSPHGPISVGIFEADGGAWRLVAIDRVRDWLREALPESVAVLG